MLGGLCRGLLRLFEGLDLYVCVGVWVRVGVSV